MALKGKITFKIDKHRYFRRERSFTRGWRLKFRGIIFTFLLCQQHCNAGALWTGTLESEDSRGASTLWSSGDPFEDDFNSLMTRQETRQERVDDNLWKLEEIEENRQMETSTFSRTGVKEDTINWRLCSRWKLNRFLHGSCGTTSGPCTGRFQELVASLWMIW